MEESAASSGSDESDSGSSYSDGSESEEDNRRGSHGAAAATTLRGKAPSVPEAKRAAATRSTAKECEGCDARQKPRGGESCQGAGAAWKAPASRETVTVGSPSDKGDLSEPRTAVRRVPPGAAAKGLDAAYAAAGPGVLAQTTPAAPPKAAAVQRTPTTALTGAAPLSTPATAAVTRVNCRPTLAPSRSNRAAYTALGGSAAAREGGGSDRDGEPMPGGPDDDHSPEADNYDDDEANRRRREANIQAMLGGTLTTERRPMLPKILRVKEGEALLRRAFKSPHPSAPSKSTALVRKLAARKVHVPWGSNKAFKPVVSNLVSLSGSEDQEPVGGPAGLEPPPAPPGSPPEENPLILWEPPEGEQGRAVQVDPMLTKFLRPHQREGVQFMFECVTGLRDFGGQGCILADDMGLGKTLQGISLLWTLLTCGHSLLGGLPVAKRVVIVCPTSLVPNWESECVKWLNGRVNTLALSEASRDDAIAAMDRFLSPRRPYHVMIVSYETFRIHAARFKPEGACDLLICDEAHRLKNDRTLTNKALGALHCKRRVLLSGTPLQNDLEEFYAMVSFCNPDTLGTTKEFNKKYQFPILAGREPGASDDEVKLGNERSEELSSFVNNFILRRTNTILSQHLPPKLVSVVCCKMTDMQELIYRHFLESKEAKKILAASELEVEGGKGKKKETGAVLGAITSLKKLCNHPKLIYDALISKSGKGEVPRLFKDAIDFFPEGVFDDGRLGRGQMAEGWEMTSGKFAVLARMLATLFHKTRDRIVVVSNYTQTLDMVAQLCREKGYPFVRLDGTVTMKKRQKMVGEFNDPASRQFAFLLSSKAGGCGLNLVGANRLILFDPDWNPANDKQAAARVWRDGQRKRVFEYRFLTSGTIEEKVFQRQLSKEGLQQAIGHGSSSGGGQGESMFSKEVLRQLFTYRETRSDTYEQVVLARQRGDEGGGDDGDGGPDSPSEDKDYEEEGSGGAEDDSRVVPSQSESDIEIVVDRSEDGGAPDTRVPAPEGPIHKLQHGKPAQEDLTNWGHHSSCGTVDDEVLRDVAGQDVTFVFTCAVDGKDEGLHPHGYESMRVPPPAPAVPQPARANAARAGLGGGPRGAAGIGRPIGAGFNPPGPTGGAGSLPTARAGIRPTLGAGFRPPLGAARGDGAGTGLAAKSSSLGVRRIGVPGGGGKRAPLGDLGTNMARAGGMTSSAGAGPGKGKRVGGAAVRPAKKRRADGSEEELGSESDSSEETSEEEETSVSDAESE